MRSIHLSPLLPKSSGGREKLKPVAKIKCSWDGAEAESVWIPGHKLFLPSFEVDWKIEQELQLGLNVSDFSGRGKCASLQPFFSPYTIWVCFDIFVLSNPFLGLFNDMKVALLQCIAGTCWNSSACRIHLSDRTNSSGLMLKMWGGKTLMWEKWGTSYQKLNPDFIQGQITVA